MAIVVRLDVVLALRKMRSKELAGKIDLTEANLSLLKSGKVKGIRFATLDAICKELNCQPGDLLEYEPGDQADRLRPNVSERGSLRRRCRHWWDR